MFPTSVTGCWAGKLNFQIHFYRLSRRPHESINWSHVVTCNSFMVNLCQSHENNDLIPSGLVPQSYTSTSSAVYLLDLAGIA
jgi:hypothetical protein